jgi:RimJ/RimL family protein N-acetyltransferase
VFAHPIGDGAELTPLEPWHAEELFAVVERFREYLAPTIPLARLAPTVDEVRASLQRFADGHANDTRHHFAVRQDGQIVGVVQLFFFDAAAGTCEMGVWFIPPAQGRGLATRACSQVLGWVFRERGLARVQWTNSPANRASGALARRLGMTREGLLRSTGVTDGVRSDNEIWSILADEWVARP